MNGLAYPTVNTIGLCAGVGMLDLGVHAGLEYLGLSARSVGYVERESYTASRLLARMADKVLEPCPVWAGNLEDVRWERWAGCVDGIIAGFPCQPHSMAGKRTGTSDDRWIWPGIVDCIRLVRPSFVYLENVGGIRSSGGLDVVFRDLATLGLAIEYDSIRASDVGASHQRERVFILAYRPGERLGEARDIGTRRAQWVSRGGTVANPNDTEGRGKNSRSPEINGNAIAGSGRTMVHTDSIGWPQRWRAGKPVRQWGTETKRASHDVLANTSQSGPERSKRRTSPGERYRPAAPRSVAELRQVLLANASSIRCHPRWRANRGNDRANAETDREHALFAPGPGSALWPEIVANQPGLAPATEPGVRMLVDGLAYVVDASRGDQLRCAGNGVVPLQAAVAFVTLARRAGIV